jgi:hypothetical protein
MPTMAKRIFAQRFTETPPPEFFTSVSEVRGEKYMTSARIKAVVVEWIRFDKETLRVDERQVERQQEGGSPG